jgi:hypothetical protein
MDWLLDPGTNKYIFQFADNNSFLLLTLFGLLFSLLKYKAKKTPSPDDDKLVEEVERKVLGLFNRSISKRP